MLTDGEFRNTTPVTISDNTTVMSQIDLKDIAGTLTSVDVTLDIDHGRPADLQVILVAPDDTVLGTRTLYHPHVDEQPFTRSLSDVQIPASITAVTVRAHDSVHEYGGETVKVAVPK